MVANKMMEILEMLAPVHYAESWDNVGLLLGNSNRDIKKVYIALDADENAINEAIKEECDMILTHHPLLFSPVKRITMNDFLGKRLLSIAENKMNYYAMHTNFDVAVMADLTSRQLGMEEWVPLLKTIDEGEIIKGIGSVGYFKETMTLRELAARVKKSFNLSCLRVYGRLDTPVQKVAMCPGSGKGMDEDALKAGADVLITGDIDHHYGLDALEKGLCMIDAGHHGLEYVFVDYMEEFFKEKLPDIKVVKDRNQSPFQIV